MENLQNWLGSLKGQRVNGAELSLKTVCPRETEERRGKGGSKPFIGIAEDDNRYWLKTSSNNQNPKIPVVEQIVGRAGILIEAPVCEVKTISIPDQIYKHYEEDETVKGIDSGISHGSLDIFNNRLVKSPRLIHCDKDNNMVRYPYLLVLYDWCYVNDTQWLGYLQEDMKCYSHDHGHFFPSKGSKEWSKEMFDSAIDREKIINFDPNDIELDHLRKAIDNLKKVGSDDIMSILKKIPTEWDIDDNELEMVGCFLEQRLKRVEKHFEEKVGI
ncbi:MAG: HipA family kinase [Flavobacteriales bacterium]